MCVCVCAFRINIVFLLCVFKPAVLASFFLQKRSQRQKEPHWITLKYQFPGSSSFTANLQTTKRKKKGEGKKSNKQKISNKNRRRRTRTKKKGGDFHTNQKMLIPKFCDFGILFFFLFFFRQRSTSRPKWRAQPAATW